jgi:hypothetical protein
MEAGLAALEANQRARIKVTALLDRISGNSREDGDWKGTRLYEVLPDPGPSRDRIVSRVIENAPPWRAGPDEEEHMGNKETLASFIGWAREAYPQYVNQVLILWKHGGGVAVGSTQTARSAGDAGPGPLPSICLDDEDYRGGQEGYGLEGQLYLGEIKEVLGRYYSPGAGKLRVIGFDACYMGMYEAAYQFREAAEYFGASPGLEFLGWNYEGLFGDPETFRDGASFTGNNVRLYAAISASFDHTMTAFDLAHAEPLKTAVDHLGTVLWEALEVEKTSPGSGLTRGDLEILRDSGPEGGPIAYWRNDTVKLSPAAEENESLYFPFFDLGSLCGFLAQSPAPSGVKTAAKGVQDALARGIVDTWKNPAFSGGGYDGPRLPRGLAIFFSRGNKTFSRSGSSQSHYASHWYYTSLATSDWKPGLYYGRLDAAGSNDNDMVETWRELMEYLYDPGESLLTPGRW